MARAASPRDAGVPRSASPQPLSKRDKRRQMMSEKLSDMVQSFAMNHFDHYYAQLSAIQCDINLVLRADPYRDAPLDDSPEAIQKAVAEARDEVTRKGQISEEAEASFNAMSGRYYAKFVEEVNRALEERDKDLTMLFNEHQNRLDELRRTNQYKIQLAHEEHALLSRTIRDRLIQTVQQKKSRLARDKEQLDIADSNALLLNPAQFSIGNPASPSGGKSNRSTRHTRGRLGETPAGAAPDDQSTSAAPSIPQEHATTNGLKRKRRAGDDDGGSPGPNGRVSIALDANGFPSPHNYARNKLFQSQFEAPLYSIDRLFSEKELALNMNRAHVATNEFFSRLRSQGIENRLHAAVVNGIATSSSNANAVNGGAADPSDPTDANTALPSAEGGAQDTSLPPSPSQTPAQPVHATRATQRLNPLNDLANAATGPAANFMPVLNPASLPPIPNAQSSSKAMPSAPSPASLTEADVSQDWALMQRDIDDPILKTLAEKCLEKRGVVDLSLVGGGGGGDGLNALADASDSRMARLHSSYGFGLGTTAGAGGAGGGVSMSRVASERGWPGVGGEPMSRSASAADHNFGRSRR